MGSIGTLGVVFCRNADCDFKSCKNGFRIRAIGNFSSKNPDEKIYIKYCSLKDCVFGSCEHQTLLNRFPTLPVFFYKDIL
jgi:hypothetical protein